MDDTIPSDLDINIWRDTTVHRGTQPHSHFKYAGSSSHVFLAACASHQRAQEDLGRGKFTAALLQELAREGSQFYTYSELIKKLADIPG